MKNSLILLVSFLFIFSTNGFSQELSEGQLMCRNYDALRKKMQGVWVSDEYRNSLFETNSITKATKQSSFYTDIVFWSDSVLHCSRPDFMEEDYVRLMPDSNLISMYADNASMRLISVDKEKLLISDTRGVEHSFTKVRDLVNPDEIYIEVTEGHKSIEHLWLKGEYTYISKSKRFPIELKADGSVVSNQKISRVEVYSYQNKDILCIKYFGDSDREFVIESNNGAEMQLHEIKNITEEGQPIEYLEYTGVLKRKM